MLGMCAPLLPLGGLAFSILLLGFVTLRWQARARSEQSGEADGSTWLLVWLFLVALVGLGAFITYAFFYLGAC